MSRFRCLIQIRPTLLHTTTTTATATISQPILHSTMATTVPPRHIHSRHSLRQTGGADETGAILPATSQKPAGVRSRRPRRHYAARPPLDVEDLIGWLEDEARKTMRYSMEQWPTEQRTQWPWVGTRAEVAPGYFGNDRVLEAPPQEIIPCEASTDALTPIPISPQSPEPCNELQSIQKLSAVKFEMDVLLKDSAPSQSLTKMTGGQSKEHGVGGAEAQTLCMEDSRSEERGLNNNTVSLTAVADSTGTICEPTVTTVATLTATNRRRTSGMASRLRGISKTTIRTLKRVPGRFSFRRLSG